MSLSSEAPSVRPATTSDDDAVGTLLADAWPGLVRLAYLLVDDRESAEDVVQDVYAGYLRRLRAGKAVADPAAYLRVSVVNRARSHLRRRRIARLWRPEGFREAEESAEQTVVDQEQATHLFEVVQQLPHRQREVLVLRYWLDLSEAEIAATLKVSTGTVKAAASRARASVKKVLEAEQ